MKNKDILILRTKDGEDSSEIIFTRDAKIDYLVKKHTSFYWGDTQHYKDDYIVGVSGTEQMRVNEKNYKKIKKWLIDGGKI